MWVPVNIRCSPLSKVVRLWVPVNIRYNLINNTTQHNRNWGSKRDTVKGRVRVGAVMG